MQKLSKEAREFFKKNGSEGGKKSSRNMTKEERIARAKLASSKRIYKKKSA